MSNSLRQADVFGLHTYAAIFVQGYCMGHGSKGSNKRQSEAGAL